MARGKRSSTADVAVTSSRQVPKVQQRGMHDRKGKGKAEEKQGEDNVNDDELMLSLRRHDASFTALLSLIPPQLYLAPQGEDDTSSVDGNMSGQQKRKETHLSTEDRKQMVKEAKRARYDPENKKSALQIQQERSAHRAALKDDDTESISFAMYMEDGDMHAGDTDDGEDGDDDDDDDDDGDSYETLPTSAKSSEELSMEKGSAFDSPTAVAAAPIGVFDLRARLQAKIQGLQAQQRASQSRDGGVRPEATGDDAESIASTKDELLEERRKKRGEMRDKRRKAAKERKRAEKDRTTSVSKSSSGNDKKGSSAPTLLVNPTKERQVTSAVRDGHVSDVIGDIAFSTLHFDGENAKKSKHALPSDPKAALAILEARKRKDEKYQAKREAQAQTKEKAEAAEPDQSHAERVKWSKAEAAAQGVKIREDESLLKKALKRKEKQKSQSAKDWKKRSRDLDSQQIARQKKRTDNIVARKERKMKGAKGGTSGSASSIKGKLLGSKKGGAGKATAGRSKKKARPGFEGKRGGGGGGKKAGGSAGGGKRTSGGK